MKLPASEFQVLLFPELHRRFVPSTFFIIHRHIYLFLFRWFLHRKEGHMHGQTNIANSVDTKTDEIMQRVIRQKFSTHTVLAVAHKLDTILDFDRVAVLDGGQLIELDDPYTLLSTTSAFAKLYTHMVTEEGVDDASVLEVDPVKISTLAIPSSSATSSIRANRQGSTVTQGPESSLEKLL
jgi:ABC-type multidrug transport system ATPase subunit